MDKFNQSVPSAKCQREKKLKFRRILVTNQQQKWQNHLYAVASATSIIYYYILLAIIPFYLSPIKLTQSYSCRQLNYDSSLATRLDTFYRTGLDVSAVVSVNLNVTLRLAYVRLFTFSTSILNEIFHFSMFDLCDCNSTSQQCVLCTPVNVV